jgi:hypothetical protein
MLLASPFGHARPVFAEVVTSRERGYIAGVAEAESTNRDREVMKSSFMEGIIKVVRSLKVLHQSGQFCHETRDGSMAHIKREVMFSEGSENIRHGCCAK